jgi:Tol biopolymer transport system component
MSTDDQQTRLERIMPRLLRDLAAPSVPDYTDDVLERTAGIRQRPRWTFAERWIPMGVIARRTIYIPDVPGRAIVLAAVLLTLLAAGLVYVGSLRHAAPPFGLARNGLLVYSAGGDIYTNDIGGVQPRLVVGGSTYDDVAGFSRDGTRLSFLRVTDRNLPMERAGVIVVDLDGTGARDLTGPLDSVDWYDWSPDHTRIVVQSKVNNVETLRVVNADGNAPARVLDLPGLHAMLPSWLPPDGGEIVFRGWRFIYGQGDVSGIFAVKPDGAGPRNLTPTDGNVDNGYLFPMPSPDGSRLTYTVWSDSLKRLQIHVLEIATGSDRVVRFGAGDTSDGYATFSPDGRKLLFNRFSGSTMHSRFGDPDVQMMVAPVDGGDAMAVGPVYSNADIQADFSPDGRTIFVNNSATHETRLVGASTGGDGELLPWAAGNLNGWQRLAP